VRSGRWALPPGIAALATQASRGPILLVSDELPPDRGLAAGALALALFAYQSLVVITIEDLNEALRELEPALVG